MPRLTGVSRVCDIVSPLKLDLESSKCYTGLGDLVMLSWLIAGRRDVDRPIHIHHTQNPDLAKLLDLPSIPNRAGCLLIQPTCRNWQTAGADRVSITSPTFSK